MDNLGKIDAAAGKLHDEDAVVDTNAPPMPQVEAVPVSAPTPTPTPTPAPPADQPVKLSARSTAAKRKAEIDDEDRREDSNQPQQTAPVDAPPALQEEEPAEDEEAVEEDKGGGSGDALLVAGGVLGLGLIGAAVAGGGGGGSGGNDDDDGGSTPANRAPTAQADVGTATEGGAVVTGSVATNDSDLDGDSLTYALSAPVAGLTLNANGGYSFDPAASAYNDLGAGETRTVVANYSVSDGRGGTATSTLTITVTGVNDAPVAAANSYATDEDMALVIAAPGVLGNDSDVDGDPLTAVLVTGPTNGTLTLNANGSFTYTPDANYSGADSFTYRPNDGTANGNTVTVNLTVNPVNDAPVAVADSYATDEDTALVIPAPGVLGNDSDIDGDALDAVLVTGPTNGTLSLNADGSFTYTPNANYNGTDSFTYKANDGAADGNTVTVALTVNPVNDAPVTVADSYATDEDTALVIPATGVLGNDSDVDGDALDAVLVTGPANGTLLLNADGSFTYTPNTNYNGADSFTYRANDGTADGNTVTVDLTVNAVNDAPTATNLSAAESYTEDTPLNLTDIVVADVDSAVTVTLTLSNTGAGSLSTGTSGSTTSTFNAGTGVWTASGSAADVNALLAAVTFSPAPNFNGSFSIATSVSDGVAPPLTGTKSVTGTAVNDAPTATNLSAAESYTEDTPLNLTDIVVADVDSAVTVTLTLSNTAAGSLSTATSGSTTSTFNAGTGVWTASGSAADVNALLAAVTFTPAPNFNGSFNIATSVSDGVAPPLTGIKAVTGTSVNDAPTATNLNAAESYTEDTPLNLTDIVVADVDSAVTVTLTLSNTAAGSLSTATSGSTTSTFNAGTGVWTASGSAADVNALLAAVTFSPALNFNGSFSIATSVSDGVAPALTGTKTVTGIAINDAPVAVGESYDVTEDVALVVPALTGVLVNDTDVDTDPLTAILVSDVSHGTLSLNADGSFTYTPDANYNGADSFTYKANDGTADGNTVTVNLTVDPVNDAPVAAADAYVTSEDTALIVPAIGVLDNDGDTDGDSLTAVLGTGPAHGTLELNADGSFTYTPNANYNGTDSFTYKANDGTTDGNTVTVSLSVTAVNDAPVVIGDGTESATTINEDSPGAGQTIQALFAAQYSDAADNQIPSGGASSPGQFSGIAVTANGSSAATGQWQYFDGTSWVDIGSVSDSSAKLFGDPFTTLLRFNPAADFSGEAPTLTVHLIDNSLGFGITNGQVVDLSGVGATGGTTAYSAGTVVLSQTVIDVNEAPVAVADAYVTNEDTALVIPAAGVLANDTDADGDALNAALVTSPTNGTLSLNADGSFTYTPNANYNGADSFSYRVNDGTVDGNTVTVGLTVNPVNDAPVAVADSYATDEDTALVVPVDGVLANDSDVDGDPLTGALVTGPTNGTLTLNANGSFTYTPNANYTGPDSFTYKVNDGTVDGNTVTVGLTVNPVNDAPVSVADAYVTNEDTALIVPADGVLANDSDVDGDALAAALVTGPTNGTLTLNTDGSFNYTPNANYTGPDSFTYKANDGTVDGNTVTVGLTVSPVNDAPVANDDVATAGEDSALIVNAAGGLLTNDVDLDGDTLSVSAVNGAAVNVGSQFTLASGALLTVNADGSYSYDANGQFEALRPGQTDTDSFTYTTTDGTDSDTATVTITINGANEAPVAGDDAFAMTGNTPITLTAAQLLGNDSDPDGLAGDLTITGVSAGSNGTVIDNGDGTFTFTPATGFEGAATFTYTVEDADGGTDVGTVTLNVADPVWYVNNATGSDVTGDGSYANPFATLAPLNTGGSADALDNADDTIFVYNAGTYSNARITLEAGQKLFGDGHDFTVNGMSIGANASNTTLSHAGVAVTLSSDNTIMGLTLEGQLGFRAAIGIDDGGNNVGTLTIDETSITGSGKAIDIDQGGTLNVDLDLLNSTQSDTEGVHLQGVSGTFNAATGLIQTSAGTGVLIGAAGGATASSGGNVAFTFGGDIASPGGSLVEIQDRTGGSVTFSGNLTEGSIGATQTGIVVDGSAGTVSFNGQTFVSAGGGAGNGVALTNNSGTINFAATGTGFDITTASGAGLTFTGGGTLNITGTGNSVTTGTGQILNLQNGTIGTSGIAFQALASGAVAAGNAININNLDGTSFNGGNVNIARTTSGDGIRIYGDSAATFTFGSTTIGDNTVNAIGGDGIYLSGANGSVTFSSVDIDGFVNRGFRIDNATNSVTVSGGSINAAAVSTGTDVLIFGGSGAVTIAADMQKPGNQSANIIDIINHSLGTISFSGDISATLGSGGINLVNNSSGNINFTGDVTLSTGASTGLNFTNIGSTGANVTLSEGSLDIDTTSGTGINATSTTVGAGSLTISGATGPGNTVTSTTGRAINVDGVTANITLNEVNVSGNGTTTGVFLKNTGASGQFVVTGDGSTAGSGGTIKDIGGANLASGTSAATTGTAIYLENVSNVSLSNMTFGSTAAGENLMSNFGIRGNNVTNFTLRDSQFLGSFGDTYANGFNNLYEGTIRFGNQGADGTGNGLTGTALFEGNVIGGGFNDNLSVFNNNNGALNMTIRDSANDQAVFTHNGLTGNDNILIETRGTGGGMGAGFNLTLFVDGVEFRGARGDNIQTVAAANTNQTITIQNSSFINSHPNVVSGGGGVTLSGGGNTSAYNVDYAVLNNVLKGAQGTALNVNYSGLNVDASGVIANNVIGTPNGTFDDSQALGGSTNGGNGISVTSEKFAGSGTVTHAVRIEGNTVADIASGIGGITLTGGNQGGGTVRIEGTVTNNVVTDAGHYLLAGFYAVVGGAALSGDTTQMGLNISNNNVAAATFGDNAFYFDQVSQDARFYFPGYVGSANGEWSAVPGTASADLSNYLDNTKANNGINGGFPSFPGIVNAGMVVGISGSAFVLPVPLLAAGTPATAWEEASDLPQPALASVPTAAELAVLVEAAIGRWDDAGASEDHLAAMRGVEFDFAELNGLRLAELTDGLIRVDTDAAGHGWYVDATPFDDSEFAAGGPGIGDSYDLLSALMHELGHQIGLDDQFAGDGSLMEGIAEAGVRTLPDASPQTAGEGSRDAMGWREAADMLDGSGGSVSSLLTALDLESSDGGSFGGASELSPTFVPAHKFDASSDFVVFAEERVL